MFKKLNICLYGLTNRFTAGAPLVFTLLCNINIQCKGALTNRRLIFIVKNSVSYLLYPDIFKFPFKPFFF